MDVWRRRKISIRSSLSARVSCPFLVRRMCSLSGEVHSIRRNTPEKGVCWMYGSYALACFLFRTHAFLVFYLSSSHPLMSGGLDSQLDYYLKRNRSTRGVLDTDCIFSGWLLTRNAWKLTNNGCPWDQTDDVHLLGDNNMSVTWLVQKRSSNIRRTFCQLLCVALSISTWG